MARCTATSQRSGERCKLQARDGDLCASHSGEPSPSQCTAKSKTTQGRCKQNARRGSNVCRAHGGNLPQVQRAAKRRLAQQRAARLLEELGGDVEPVTDPVSELGAIAGRMRTLEQLLWGELHPMSDVVTRPDPAAVEVYQDAADRLAKQLQELQKLGLFEMQVTVEQQKAQMLATALQSVLRDLDLSPAQRAKAPGLIRQHLLSLTTGNGSEVTA